MNDSHLANSPHDAFFVSAFGEPVRAREWLPQLLPEAVVQCLNWQSLEVVDGSTVDPQLHKRHTDILYKVRSADDEAVLVYCLFEHQSTPRRDMGLRLLLYMARIWDQWRK
ncbi:MAG: Rpn family recombination-promoting nuclease/putative transposase, partial [Verrucomicrobia bacterium]|nr:Rpn family recombination-promoting nuclease/putative transposase [Verrucomicrobiota bacterium]